MEGPKGPTTKAGPRRYSWWMMTEILATTFAVAVLIVPILVLSPVIDRLFENGQFRAIIRRAFRIDPGATIADPPRRSQEP
jgi:hypothetical protein